jgi:SAM-dependent methyltransferase
LATGLGKPRRLRVPESAELKLGSAPPLSLHAWLRFDAIQRLIPPETRTLLEIGAGLGSAGALLARRFAYVGLEPDGTSFRTAVERIGSCGTVLNVPAELYEPTGPFDAVCAFEVLEHLEDDRAAVVDWKRFVRPGGWLLVSVPAGRHRFGPTDVKAGHYRRYDRADLTRVLVAADLVDVEIVAYGFPLGYGLEAGRNLLVRKATKDTTFEQRTAASGRWLQPSDRSAPLMRALSAPFRVVQRPFGATSLGTGLVARARLPE